MSTPRMARRSERVAGVGVTLSMMVRRLAIVKAGIGADMVGFFVYFWWCCC